VSREAAAGANRSDARTTAKVTPNPLFIDAILQRRRLAVLYRKGDTDPHADEIRIVEPQCYGIGFKGSERLRVHQIRGGGPQKEPLFDVSKIIDCVLLDEHFTKPGPNYKKNDSAMKIIFAQL
jgi:hypothetical protein